MPGTERTFQTELIKYGVAILGALVLAGAVSLANRNVYSKEQVDLKFDTHNQVQRVQNQRVLDKLEVIKEDVGEIKEQMKDNPR